MKSKLLGLVITSMLLSVGICVQAQVSETVYEIVELYQEQPELAQKFEEQVASDAVTDVAKEGKNTLKKAAEEAIMVADAAVTTTGKAAAKSEAKTTVRSMVRSVIKKGGKYLLALLLLPFIFLYRIIVNVIEKIKNR